MKEHFCPAEQSIITYQGECSWCGEREALAQTQEPVPPPWWPAVENILTEYGLQAIDFVADFKQALARTQEPKIGCVNHDCDKCKAQRTWVGLTDDEQQYVYEQWQNDGWGVFYNAIEAKLKEKNK